MKLRTRSFGSLFAALCLSAAAFGASVAHADATYISTLDGSTMSCEDGCYCSYDTYGNEIVRDANGEQLAPVAAMPDGQSGCEETCEDHALLDGGTLELIETKVQDGGIEREFEFEFEGNPEERVLMSTESLFEEASFVSEVDYGFEGGEIQPAIVLVCGIFRCKQHVYPASVSCADLNMAQGQPYRAGPFRRAFCWDV